MCRRELLRLKNARKFNLRFFQVFAGSEAGNLARGRLSAAGPAEKRSASRIACPTNKLSYFLILLQAVAAPVTSIAADPSSMC